MIAERGVSRAHRLYRALPEPVAAVASELQYRLSAKHPVVWCPPEQTARLARGAVVFSIDFEMAWAWQYARIQEENPVTRGLRERAQVPLILQEFERAQIPATWATVGHLFLSSCGRDAGGRAHEEIPPVPHFTARHWAFTSGDWFQHDPGTNVRRDPAWYAPDLIEAIMRSPVGHEIGCHSFSHMGFNERYCPPELAAAELRACISAMKPYGLRPVSWVFPGNDAGNFAALAEGGIRVVRTFPRPAEISLPVRREDGLWGEHASLVIETRPGSLNRVVRLLRLKSYLKAAMHERMAMHVWFHPSVSPADLHGVLFPFLAHCGELRDQGKIDVLTMRGLVLAAGGDPQSLNDHCASA